MTVGVHKAKRSLPAILAELEARDLTFDFAAIARKHGVLLAEVMGPRRQGGVTDARLECYNLLRERGWSYPRIGQLFDRNHQTIVRGVEHHLRRQLGAA